ncbi:hypothetical protein MRB53_019273 [Persea americana]|uniref:Uncharacterized protein n=1 Tax=Persea americana TaxID=3435 RepID=A0ACC2KXR6_PERAE|nr:hypothetical protein MRB53_019273 [Persea americana]
MKASLKLREGNQNPLVRAKIPVSVLGLPFISSVVSGNSSDLSFHLRSASAAGPSFKVSYSPNDPSNNPFTFSVKSGVGAFGSPDRSPLVLSAQFSLLGTLNPSFSLQIKPQIGDFSLKKIARSNPNPNHIKENGVSHLDQPQPTPSTSASWPEIRHAGGGFFSGVALTAKTLFPVTKQLELNFRWGLNIPADISRKNLPFLTVDKFCIERIEPEKQLLLSNDGPRVYPLKSSGEVRDLEVLKGMCFWMGREVEALQRENQSMKESIEEMKRLGIPEKRSQASEIQSPAKRATEMKGDSGEFERWRKRKQNEGGDDGRRDVQVSGFSGSSGNDVEEELKRAIKAAAA